MMPLINPGKYDAAFNQEYLLTKLHKIDIFMTLFWAFWISVFLCITVYVIIKALRASKCREKQDLFKQQVKSNNKILDEFQSICRLIYEDLHVFKRPQKMVDAMYYDNLKELVHKMSKMEAYVRDHFPHLIPDYKYYREKFIKDEIDGKQHL
jgi:hypothetical protein